MRRLSAVTIITALLVAPAALHADNTFYRVLAAKPNATFADAVQGFFNLALDTPAGKRSFDEQAQALIDMKVIRQKWTRTPEARLTRGRVAYMICRTCGIRGGLTMWVLGNSERYAYRECQYLEVWSGGSQQDYMTGGEVLGVLKWAADYIEEHPGRKVKPRGSAVSIREPAPAPVVAPKPAPAAVVAPKPAPAAVVAPKPAPAADVATELDAAERAKKK